MIFSLVTFVCENWRELDHKEGRTQRIDAFKLWCCRRLLRLPWTARRSNQSILRELSPEYSLEGLMLKLQYFGHLIRTDSSLEKSMMLGKIEDRREKWIPIPFLWSLTFSLKLETEEHQFILLDKVLLKSPGNKWSCRGNCWSGSCLHSQAHLNYSGSHF